MRCEVCGGVLPNGGITHCSEECIRKSVEKSKKFDPAQVKKKSAPPKSGKKYLVKKRGSGLQPSMQTGQYAKTATSPEPAVAKVMSLGRRSVTGLEHVAGGSHVLYTYRQQRSKYEEAFRFLKRGLENNEATVLIFNKLEGADIRQRIKHENVNLGRLESAGRVYIMTPDESYYKNGFPNTSRVVKFWETAREKALAGGMNGLRVFADMHPFFENGDVDETINYESELSHEYESTLTGVCAYNLDDIKNLSPRQYNIVISHQIHHLN
ncbi:MAG: MEDS domain-containing protein [Thaumarchaeota archaeon]|nr:MEDS domain-containing protein [Nitrososphaerota archaeon]